MTPGDAPRGMQDAALLLELFKASGLTQMDLRTPDLDLYVARGGGRRRATAAEADGPGPRPAALALRAPHLATLVRIARPGDRVPAGRPWATIAVLGAESPLAHDADITVRAALAAPGDLVEYDAALLEADGDAP